MRIQTLLLCVLLPACHSAPPEPAVPGAVAPQSDVVEATLAGRVVTADPVAEVPVVVAVDPVVAELLRSAWRGYATRRRIALENIANAHTPGYRKRIALVRNRAVENVDGARVQFAVQQDAVPLFTSGVLEASSRVLDIAIDGDGFYRVLRSDGSDVYTRHSSWQLDARGRVVTGDGMALVPGITIPNDTLVVRVSPDGEVSGRTAGSPDTTTRFGAIEISRFMNPEGLVPVGPTLWGHSSAAGNPIRGTPGSNALGHLRQGFVEGSNVDLAHELMSLQLLEREHAVLTRVLQQFGMIAP